MPRRRTPKSIVSAPPAELAASGEMFDRLRRLAKALFAGCDAQVVLVQEDTAWRSHDPKGRLPPDAPGARVAVAEGKLLWVADAREDNRFKHRKNVRDL